MAMIKSILAFVASMSFSEVHARVEDFTFLDSNAVKKQPFEVLNIYRRSDPSFIQGLYYDIERSQLIETTGLYGESVTQWLNLDDTTGDVSPSETIVPFKM